MQTGLGKIGSNAYVLCGCRKIYAAACSGHKQFDHYSWRFNYYNINEYIEKTISNSQKV